MNGTDIAMIIGQLAVLISAVATGVVQLRNSKKLDQQDVKLTSAVGNIEKIEIATNSMKDALVKATAKASFAEGVKSETDKEAAK